ncbi:MazG-like family protein [Oceanobacillus oncorhynchi]|uniref:MazG-like family protein n=1 Tax=Oceanobacillus oncorhynchi TaxID=545501 RepID=UPI001866878C|nr:MazG-like family protein [Oceanobacillus oncorhynchi]
MNLNNQTRLIRKWAKERGLDNADPAKQMLKLAEEHGELAAALAKGRHKSKIEDAVGDMYVVMTILCMQLDIEIESCIDTAYDEIQDRDGKMVNGVFVKEEDLT